MDFCARTEGKGGDRAGGEGQRGDSESDFNETLALFGEVWFLFLK